MTRIFVTVIVAVMLAGPSLSGCSDSRDSTIIKSGDEAAAAAAQGKQLVRPDRTKQ
jgi:hypothetical protein